MKYFLPIAIIAAILLTAILTAFLYVVNNSTDSPPYDDSDIILVHNPVPDESNAFTYFSMAEEDINWGTNKEYIAKLISNNTWDSNLFASIVNSNTSQIQYIEMGLSCAGCQAPVANFPSNDYSYIMNIKILTRLLKVHAVYYTNIGNQGAAVKSCAQLISTGKVLMNNHNNIVDTLVAVAVYQNGYSCIENLMCALPLSDKQLNMLIGALPSRQAIYEQYKKAFKTEYVFCSRILDEVLTGKPLHPGYKYLRYSPTSKTSGYFFQINRTKKLLGSFVRNAISNMHLPYDQVDLLASDLPKGSTSTKMMKGVLKPNMIGRNLVELQACVHPVIIKNKCRFTCDTDALRLALACKRYYNDHTAYPSNLTALIPDYIDSIPLNSFNLDPIRYSYENRLIYSTNANVEVYLEKPLNKK